MPYKNKYNKRKYNREWNKLHPDRMRGIARLSNIRRLELIRTLKDVPCSDCGVEYPHYVMEFDHVREEKLFNVGSTAHKGIGAILDEIDKCDVVCANCHRTREWDRNQIGVVK